MGLGPALHMAVLESRQQAETAEPVPTKAGASCPRCAAAVTSTTYRVVTDTVRLNPCGHWVKRIEFKGVR